MIESVVIMGGCGGFGRAFSQQFRALDSNVTTIDRDASADVVIDFDHEHLSEQLSMHLTSCDLLLLCLPERQCLSVLSALSDTSLDTALISDICSVKTNVCAAAQRALPQTAYVSIHPMFGPERGFAQQNLVFIPVQEGGPTHSAIVAQWQQLLSSWGANVVTADASTHDRVASMVQVLTHATLISFAKAQSHLQVPDELFAAMTTPIFRALDDTAQGMLRENPDLYHYIQSANPYAGDARAALGQAVQEVLLALGQDESGDVRALFDQLARRTSD